MCAFAATGGNAYRILHVFESISKQIKPMKIVEIYDWNIFVCRWEKRKWNANVEGVFFLSNVLALSGHCRNCHNQLKIASDIECYAIVCVSICQIVLCVTWTRTFFFLTFRSVWIVCLFLFSWHTRRALFVFVCLLVFVLRLFITFKMERKLNF